MNTIIRWIILSLRGGQEGTGGGVVGPQEEKKKLVLLHLANVTLKRVALTSMQPCGGQTKNLCERNIGNCAI